MLFPKRIWRGVRQKGRRGARELFYSEDKDEEETDRRANCLARDIGDGEEIAALGKAARSQALCRVWCSVHSDERAASI